MQGTGWDLMTNVNYIIVTFIVYTSGDVRSNPHNARKLSFSLSVVNFIADLSTMIIWNQTGTCFDLLTITD